MHPKDADRMANNVDHDQTAPLTWVYTVQKLKIITVPWVVWTTSLLWSYQFPIQLSCDTICCPYSAWPHSSMFIHAVSCEIRKIFKGDLITFCEIFTKSPKIVKSLYLNVRCLWYGNLLPDGPNSVRFYLTVWGMACMMFWHNLLPSQMSRVIQIYFH